MEREGLWRLFFATGLPEAWLAVRKEGPRTGQGPEGPWAGPVPGEDRGTPQAAGGSRWE